MKFRAELLGEDLHAAAGAGNMEVVAKPLQARFARRFRDPGLRTLDGGQTLDGELALGGFIFSEEPGEAPSGGGLPQPSGLRDGLADSHSGLAQFGGAANTSFPITGAAEVASLPQVQAKAVQNHLERQRAVSDALVEAREAEVADRCNPRRLEPLTLSPKPWDRGAIATGAYQRSLSGAAMPTRSLASTAEAGDPRTKAPSRRGVARSKQPKPTEAELSRSDRIKDIREYLRNKTEGGGPSRPP